MSQGIQDPIKHLYESAASLAAPGLPKVASTGIKLTDLPGFFQDRINEKRNKVRLEQALKEQDEVFAKFSAQLDEMFGNMESAAGQPSK
ncbi:hypothetical protein ABW19_dt0200245 [Dactylella cylindrospora]|nr:hypothetical protein ABW19_dt0200245 [Dactylella cylindrospora]